MFSHLHKATRDQQPNHIKRAVSPRVLAMILVLAGFALRLYKLGGESLWYDETVSVYLATEPLVELIGHTARDIHPPGYYLMLYAWRVLRLDSNFSMLGQASISISSWWRSPMRLPNAVLD
jgi:hypothetical protein